MFSTTLNATLLYYYHRILLKLLYIQTNVLYDIFQMKIGQEFMKYLVKSMTKSLHSCTQSNQCDALYHVLLFNLPTYVYKEV